MPSPIPTISFGGGELSPSVYSRIDLQKFGSGAKRLRDYFVHAEGGISNRPGIDYIRETKDSTGISRVIAFEYNEDQSYALEFGEQYMRVYRNGGIVVESGFAVSAATQANPVVITTATHGYSNGDEVFISGVAGMTELNGKFFIVANVTGTTFELTGVDGTAYGAWSSGGEAARVFTLTMPYLASELEALKFRQSNDVLYLSHRNHAPRKLSRTDHDVWTITTIAFEPEQAAPTGVSVTPTGGSGGTSYSYYVTAISDETGEESVVASGTTGTGTSPLSSTAFNRITFSAASGASRYDVYKLDNGLYGFIGSTETTTFDDKNIDPDFEDTAPTLSQPFATSGNYPGAVGLHEQRSVWGNTDNKPLNTFLSQTSQFENMSTSSPSKATDAITLRMVTGKGNEIRHFRSFRELLFVFTSGAVWTLGPGGNADGITPSSKQLKVQEYLGSTNVPPMTIKTSMLMVSGKAERGFEIHSIGEDVNSGVAGNYVGSDLTVLSRHLFEGHTIKEWAYIERPYRLVLCVRDDGKIICMTYLNEHQIYAFSIWETEGGEFESVCSVPEGQEDTAYFVVKRTINGAVVRNVEKLHSRQFTDIADAFFVDSGLTFDGTDAQVISGATAANPVVVTSTGHSLVNGETVAITDVLGMTELNNKEYTVANVAANTFELSGVDGSAYTAYTSAGTVQKKYSTVSGLDHLEGETVVALADGNLTEGLVVASGSVTIPDNFVKAHVGLPYQPLIESMPINGAATTISKRKIVKAVIMRVLDTRGIWAGTKEDNLQETPTRSNELWGDPAAAKSTIVRVPVPDDWRRDSSIICRANVGLPQTILSIVADTDVGGG